MEDQGLTSWADCQYDQGPVTVGPQEDRGVQTSPVLGPARVLISGIDTLEVFSRGAVAHEVAERLEEAKRWAVDGGKAVELPMLGHPFRVSPARTRRAPYLLESEAMALSVNPQARGNFPQVSAEVRSAFLWQHGAVAAGDRVAGLLHSFGGYATDPIHVTRVDLTVDFQGRPFGLADGARFVRRAKRLDVHLYGPHVTGLSIGAGGVVMARVYNKTQEIRQCSPDKAWFYDLWRRSPAYLEGEDVWRLEFQIRRQGLTDLTCDCGVKGQARHAHDCGRIETWGDVQRSARALWDRLTSSWLRLDGRRTRKRRMVMADDWIPLNRDGFAGPEWLAGQAADLTRRGRAAVLRRDDGQLAGHLARAAAIHMLADPAATVEEGIRVATERAEVVLREKGLSLQVRAEERVAAHLDALAAVADKVKCAPPPPPVPHPDPWIPPETLVTPPPAQVEMHIK
jgi:hypothetical protein